MKLNPEIEREFIFKSSRSGGPGGQNVNKVETKVELQFNLPDSAYLSQEQKDLISKKLKNKINKEGILIIFSQSERSQSGNKKLAIKKFFQLIAESLKKPKMRIPTRATKKSLEKRLKEKKILSEKKKLRKGEW